MVSDSEAETNFHFENYDCSNSKKNPQPFDVNVEQKEEIKAAG